MVSRGLKNLHISEKLGVAVYSSDWMLVMRLLTLSTVELMTGVYRVSVRFACYVSVTGVDRALETLLWDLLSHLDKLSSPHT